MKTRTLIRKHGWTAVDVDANKVEWNMSFWDTKQADIDNKVHYKEIVEWCERAAGSGNFASTLQNGSFAHNKKRFIFKEAKIATMFRLKWLTS